MLNKNHVSFYVCFAIFFKRSYPDWLPLEINLDNINKLNYCVTEYTEKY